MSAGPPAANGTMIVAVLAGYSWACALFIPATIRRTAVIIECFATYRLPDIVIVVTICWFFRTSRVGVVAVRTGRACQTALGLQPLRHRTRAQSRSDVGGRALSGFCRSPFL